MRKPARKDRNSFPSILESSASLVEGRKPIARLKEEQPQLTSSLKYPSPVAQKDEDSGSGRDERLSDDPHEYGTFVRPFPHRMCEMLIADDSHRNRRDMPQILQSAGYVCDTAYDGQMAVDKVNTGS